MRNALVVLVGALVAVSAAACDTPHTSDVTTTVTVTSSAAIAPATVPNTPAPVPHSACADLGGTADGNQVCNVHTATPSYTIDVSFPVDYPDQQAITDLVTRQRNQFIGLSDEQPVRSALHALKLTGNAYQSAGSRSLVFEEFSDIGGAHPETYYEALNFDLGKHGPITLDTLFKPGVDAAAVLDPIIKQELQNRLQGAPVEDNTQGTKTYENFVLTDDAVIFFIGQGMLSIEAAGPQQVSVQRSQLASVLT